MTLTDYIAGILAESRKNNTLLDKAFKSTRDDFPCEQPKSNKTPWEKQVDLKKRVSKELNGSFVNDNANDWIVHKWGGITNFIIDDRVCKFKDELHNEKILLSRSSYSVISSLSKIASFVNPEEFFVYDSRVAYTIDVLIMEYNENHDEKEPYFRVPSSQGSRTGEITKAIKSKNGTYRNNEEYYSEYLDLIKKLYQKVFTEKKGYPFEVEMLLFALGATGGEMEQRLKKLSPNAFSKSSSSQSAKNNKVKSRNEEILRVQRRAAMKGYCVLIGDYPNLVLFIGREGKHSGAILPFYCELIIDANEGELNKILEPDLYKDLSSVFDYIPRKTGKYMYSTKEKTFDEAKVVFEKALKVLKKHGRIWRDYTIIV